MTKPEIKKIVLEREQYYLDLLSPYYNILKFADSSLGSKHTNKTKALISESIKGKIPSTETRAKMTLAKSGKKSPFYNKMHFEESLAKINIVRKGKFHTDEAKALISKAMSGENNPMFSRVGKDFPNFVKSFTLETKTKMSLSKKGDTIFVYSFNCTDLF